MSALPVTPAEVARTVARKLRLSPRPAPGVIHTVVIEPEPFARTLDQCADEIDRLAADLAREREENRQLADRERYYTQRWQKAFCERDAERERAEQAERERDDYRTALDYIAKSPCYDRRNDPEWSCLTHDGTGLWCDSCTAKAALGRAVDGK